MIITTSKTINFTNNNGALDEEFEYLQPVFNGVPASQESDNSEDPMSDLLVEELSYEDYLHKSIKKFSEGKFKGAHRMFENILKTYPNDPNALFYRAYCSFELKNFERAEEEFELSADCPNIIFEEESSFHLAVCLYQNEKYEASFDLMKKINLKGGFYASQAEDFLNQKFP